jgi:1,4-alpha-glucan branching enzyme
MVAEESTAWPGVTRSTEGGGLGFGFKWNMGWMHDTLDYVVKEPIHRQYHHNEMTFATVYAWSENFVLPISHDEVVHGKRALSAKMPGDHWQRLANVRALLGFMWSFPGKQLIFMGCELGDEREWSEQRGLDWSLRHDPPHAGVSALVRDLNAAYVANSPLWTQDTVAAGFSWIIGDDAGNNVFAYERRSDDGSRLVCVVNFAAVPHEGYRMGLPLPGRWREIVNTDAPVYGGSGVGNLGVVIADGPPSHGREHSAVLRLPPLGALWLTPA